MTNRVLVGIATLVLIIGVTFFLSRFISRLNLPGRFTRATPIPSLVPLPSDLLDTGSPSPLILRSPTSSPDSGLPGTGAGVLPQTGL